nr:hypothetical protein CFP56_56996 [Quercus suber]
MGAMDLPELTCSPARGKTPILATALPRGALSRSISSSIFNKIFISPRKRSSTTPSTPARPRAKLTKRTLYSSSRKALHKRNPAAAVARPTCFQQNLTTAAAVPASPPSSFYSASSSASSASRVPSPDRDSLASLVQSLMISPLQPHTPRRPPIRRTLSPLSDIRPSPRGTPAFRIEPGLVNVPTFICAIHAASGVDFRTIELQCIGRVVDAGGKILERLVPGGFIYVEMAAWRTWTTKIAAIRRTTNMRNGVMEMAERWNCGIRSQRKRAVDGSAETRAERKGKARSTVQTAEEMASMSRTSKRLLWKADGTSDLSNENC